jgi:four helix bundle protein
VKRKHHDLQVWQEAMKLVREVYRLTSSFPKEEIYALTSQMRRSVISIPSNIAEGAARNGDKEFLQFLYISRGSLSELETQVMIAAELGYSGENMKLMNSIDKNKIYVLLSGLIHSVRKRSEK